MQVQFYHLTTTPLERALPKLMEKVYGSGMRAVLLASPAPRVEQLSDLLWTYDPASFLPHGSARDGNAALQPIYLAESLPAPNEATLAVVTNGTLVEDASFTRILDVFDGSDETTVQNARTRWKHYKDAGHEISYLKQTPAGGWEKVG